MGRGSQLTTPSRLWRRMMARRIKDFSIGSFIEGRIVEETVVVVLKMEVGQPILTVPWNIWSEWLNRERVLWGWMLLCYWINCGLGVGFLAA